MLCSLCYAMLPFYLSISISVSRCKLFSPRHPRNAAPSNNPLLPVRPPFRLIPLSPPPPELSPADLFFIPQIQSI